MELADIAKNLNVPIILVNISDQKLGEIEKYHGLEITPTLSWLPSFAHEVCQQQAMVFPDILHSRHPKPSGNTEGLNGNYFFVGLPVFDDARNAIGTFAVLTQSRNVAISGFSVQLLRSLAQEYYQGLVAANRAETSRVTAFDGVIQSEMRLAAN